MLSVIFHRNEEFLALNRKKICIDVISVAIITKYQEDNIARIAHHTRI